MAEKEAGNFRHCTYKANIYQALTYHTPNVLCALSSFLSLTISLRGIYYYYVHFSGEETEA